MQLVAIALDLSLGSAKLARVLIDLLGEGENSGPKVSDLPACQSEFGFEFVDPTRFGWRGHCVKRPYPPLLGAARPLPSTG